MIMIYPSKQFAAIKKILRKAANQVTILQSHEHGFPKKSECPKISHRMGPPR